MPDTYNTIKQAIELQRVLKLTIKYGLGDPLDVDFEPYILGEDTLQYNFVWGLLSHSGLFYKFLIEEQIIKASLGKSTYKIDPDAVYQYGIEEAHYAVAQGFDRIYGQAALPKRS